MPALRPAAMRPLQRRWLPCGWQRLHFCRRRLPPAPAALADIPAGLLLRLWRPSQPGCPLFPQERHSAAAPLAVLPTHPRSHAPLLLLTHPPARPPTHLPSQVEEELAGLGLGAEAVSGLLAALATRSVADLAELLGPEGAEATDELRRLFELGEAYGLGEWLVFDASVVRGLAYYTGEPAPAPVCDP